jgi:y4mF family transcriptional regulator
MVTARSIGQAIRRKRVAASLTQRELAAACGVGERFIVELENGKESCRLGLTLRVAEAVGLAIHVDEPSEEGPALRSRPRRRQR